MTCACGMDSVGTCLVCGVRLCPEHALRGSEQGGLDTRTRAKLYGRVRILGVSPEDLSGTFPISMDGVRSDLRPLLRFQAQRQDFVKALGKPGVICGDCRFNDACEAAGATQPTAPSLEAGGSQRLQDAVVAYILGDAVAWDSMTSDAAVKDALFQDLIHLAREKAERFQVPVEWEASRWTDNNAIPRCAPGKVRATEEAFHVVDVTVYEWDRGSSKNLPTPSPQYMNRYGQWGTGTPAGIEEVKTGWFSKEEVFRASWSDEPPKTGLDNILKRAAELLAPAA